MIPKETAVKMIAEMVVIMIRNVASETTTETNYKQQEILEDVIKYLNEKV